MGGVLAGKGKFSRHRPLQALLDVVGRDRSAVELAFVARNFLLDEGVSDMRRDSYLSFVRPAAGYDFARWKKQHQEYLGRLVYVENHGQGDPPSRLSADPDETPETFLECHFSRSPFVPSGSTLGLLRVAAVKGIASRVNETEQDVLTAAEGALSGDRRAKQDLDDILMAFTRMGQLRPVFAALWEDVADLFADPPHKDVPGWPDALRDRLGLLQYSPLPGEDIPVLVFRYMAKIVARTTANIRPLMAPTVLDGAFSAAFCPAPLGEACGHTVDLSPSPRVPVGKRRELLHPAVRWRADYLWRVGRIARPPSDLATARGLHLLDLRDQPHNAGYAEGTDRDLFR